MLRQTTFSTAHPAPQYNRRVLWSERSERKRRPHCYTTRAADRLAEPTNDGPSVSRSSARGGVVVRPPSVRRSQPMSQGKQGFDVPRSVPAAPPLRTRDDEGEHKRPTQCPTEASGPILELDGGAGFKGEK
jgi:hypothetical protein